MRGQDNQQSDMFSDRNAEKGDLYVTQTSYPH